MGCYRLPSNLYGIYAALREISDLYGRRPVYQFSIVVFLIGSFLSGAAASMEQLIFFRAIQGLGAGGLMALTFVIVGDIVSPRERGKYQGLFGAVWGYLLLLAHSSVVSSPIEVKFLELPVGVGFST